MKAFIFGIAFISCVASTNAHGEDSADFLYDACKKVANHAPLGGDEDLFMRGLCLGKVGALNWIALDLKTTTLRSCAPKNVTNDQLVKVVVAYLDKHLNRLHEPFSGLVLLAFADAWPCQNSN